MEVTTFDVFGNAFTAQAADLKLRAHVYGIAVQKIGKGPGRVLIVPQFGGYDYPGGTLEPGETHLDALVREFKEETGLDCQPLHLLNVYSSFFHHDRYNKDYQSLLIFYAVKITGGKISTEGFDRDEKLYSSQAEWLTIPELKQLHHACSSNISGDLIAYAEELLAHTTPGKASRTTPIKIPHTTPTKIHNTAPGKSKPKSKEDA
ncbi:NUDIX domain-containing protein [Candidatus Saccharibacteria bacterium]|nr:NUDIX domain-containing protein [Candidatus Saccharibacteria bacterium]